ncbi:hypothetical protein MarbSA_12450 [Methanobrevibacter arboriphilus]|uniref:Uncharacterized protein n=1 Tax=Methanobrevibacter arboriphilus TaxID=39441 RepID=A0ACA8R5J9_METAZ|nr:hypothetical protein MarbSA_12450 [Methanobrevibacter arboriphilus]
MLKNMIYNAFNLYKNNFISINIPKISNNTIKFSLKTSKNLNDFFHAKNFICRIFKH